MAAETVAQSVLVVDDSADIHELIGARLKSERIQLLHAYNAGQGLEKARRELPDLILLDLNMPGSDGFVLCRQLKEDPALTHIPVIFLTGVIDVPTKVRAFELGAVDYVTKPFDAIELKARVRGALRTKRYHDLLASKAQIDALTGLWNRGHLNEQLGISVSTMQRHGTPVSLVLTDIDHFKDINDTHGHPFGDKAIQSIADAFSRVSRDNDVLCRYGGEEFAIILRGTSMPGARAIAERLRQEILEIKLRTDREEVRLTASFGVASSQQFDDPKNVSPQTLLKLADEALYRAKSNGRDQVV